MPNYHVNLPRTIPGRLFNNLDGNIHDGIRRNLSNAYDDVEKDTYSQGASSLDALSHVFNRDLRTDARSARSLIKMFRPVVDDYVALHEPIVEQAQPEPVQPAQPAQPLEQRALQGELNLGI